MSSHRGSNNGGGAGVQSIPPAARKIVQSLKEIVNRPELEIYATLKDSHMDPDEAVNRLLSQDPFREVKSKRDKKKENKDSAESRSRSGSNTSNRGARSGTDRYVGRGGSTQFSSSDSGPPHGKVAYRKENGTNPYTSSSSTAPGGSAHRTFQHPPAPSDFVADEKKASTLSRADGNLSASQPSTGYQPAWVGAHGQKSMADIVKMGKPQSKVSSTPTSSHYSVEDAKTSVAAETANMHQLSIHEEDHEAAYEEDTPSVVIPDHLQVQSADCSHLSFGSFGSALTGYSDPFASRSSRGNIEETHLETDAPATGHSDTRNSEYYGDESIRAAADANLVHRTSGDAAGYDSPSAPQEELLKQEHSEVAHGNQYAFPSSSTGYTFESAQQLNGMNASYNYSQTSAQMQNLPFSSSMASLPNTLLAANVHPARESELPYSPFPMSQSVPNKYGNTVSSISGSSISVAEALKTGFQSVQSTQQTPSGTSVATGPALPQHLVHPYSQPTLPLGPFANMISYPFLPQSYTYMPSGFQQAFAGNNTYHQSLAAVLPQYKSSASVSNLPQSAAVPSGYGAFGSSTAIPANYAMNPTAASPAGSTMGYDDILSSQYKDSNHLISLQQNDNPGMWLHGPGSRTMSAVPASTYYSFQGQNQQPGGYRQGQQPSQNYGNLGYPNFYHSQTGVPLEHQPQNPRDGALSGSQGQPKQSQQIWQNGY
ncbi:hypothetical protein DCAR_0208940 [Daucus carota subsp. sativus]|uniref:GBF-interacting protein 1 N-terminal domain-containing protein n=1 Tax=Daucus carota subsp. sativus TaxID=79200 RepID=A0AAF1AQZ2_DAUCS|nr:hypothetical protein DCAR_0208940 [Daucus carota subsp. sativus]